MFGIGHVRIDDDDADQALARIEDLHAKTGGPLADAGVDQLARLDGAPAEGELDLGDGIDVGQQIGHDGHLRQTLDENPSSIGSPFAVGQISIDGSIHVAWSGRVISLAGARYSISSSIVS